MEIQLSHQEFKSAPIEHQIVLIAENIRTPENVGMIMRLSEAFGVEKIYFVGEHAIELTTKVKRASRNTHKTMKYEFGLSAQKELEKLKDSGYQAIALEITNRSIPIQNVKAKQYKKLVLIVGSERQGISEELLQLCENHYHIPMFGENSSINVVNALAIGLYQISEMH
ncbi:TrmH family RNA methyltransferase [Marivirga sp.]|uniref:TrmH family RNA methyltransferase n=1 Tax=Marivirga sp. TaxID=2018662 RepID=UPI002D7E25CF|nr:TrmH family RNA methyltransferase [Marivirga sp.]HET8859469.1 TrmH family RNA methyltransferase [Marivirga sp.]